MIGILIAIALVVAAYRTKPDANSFRTFLKNAIPKSSVPGPTWLKKLTNVMAGTATIPDFKIDDIILCSLATLEDGTAYLGIFGTWFFLSSGYQGPVGSPIEVEAEATRDKANRFKAERKLGDAANTFAEAARLFERIGTEFSDYDAALCYDEAYKAYNVLKDKPAASHSLASAARLFDAHLRTAHRAAKAYEILGAGAKAQKDFPRALDFYTKAKRGFERVGDARSIGPIGHLAEICAVLGLWSEARTHYETLAELCDEKEALRFSVAKYVYHACLCVVAEGDWVKAKLAVDEYEYKYASFSNTKEANCLKKLIGAYERFDDDKFTQAFEEMKRDFMLPPWAFEPLEHAKDVLEKGGVSFT
ncbi:vesicular-fusion protein S17 [Borealophlyctis nickersoniae]|nr:vesicular-fusion protein S17 [Borealophlyctis nickersoniae]